jgi:hypothetical protein
MKSQIHENRKNKLLSLSKKVLMLVAIMLGTSVMVNAKTIPTKTAPAKEVKVEKHKKHKKHRAEKQAAAIGAETSKAKK